MKTNSWDVMKLIWMLVLPVASSMILSGCVTTGQSDWAYASPPATGAPKHEIQVNEPFDVVWDRIVSRLATGFFVINNIDKASRLINVSFSGDSPGTYIDCGRTSRNYLFNGERQMYAYAVSESSTFKATKSWGPLGNLPIVQEVSRNTSVEGRINIYVAPVSTQVTKVSANVKYVLEISVRGVGTAYNAFGVVVNQVALTPSLDRVSFTTAESATKDFGSSTTQRVTCQTTGKLEQALLDTAKR
jgi:hypothetical protein